MTRLAVWFIQQPRWVQKGLFFLDVFVNWKTGGEPGETLSERWAESRETDAFAHAMCALLDQIDLGHCDKADKPGH